ARKPGELNPPYAGGRLAADAGYKGWGARVARPPISTVVPANTGIHHHHSQLSCEVVLQLFKQCSPRGMGPCFRRDDGYYHGPSHRHLPVPYRRTNRQAFCRIDDGVGVDAVVAVEVGDSAGRAKMLDAERLDAGAADAAEPAQRRRVT